MDYKIIWSPSARHDLKIIIAFIAEDDGVIAGVFGQKLLELTERTSTFPKVGRVVPGFHEESIRELLLASYRIVYRINEQKRLIEIVRIWHGARGVPEI